MISLPHARVKSAAQKRSCCWFGFIPGRKNKGGYFRPRTRNIGVEAKLIISSSDQTRFQTVSSASAFRPREGSLQIPRGARNF